MSYRVLHLVDVWLPLTMNWLESLLNQSADRCEHHVFATHYVREVFPPLHATEKLPFQNYPISTYQKIQHKFLKKLRFRQFKEQILRVKPQLIHVHFGHVATEYLDVLAASGIPYCVSLYGFDYEYLPRQKPQTIEKYRLMAQQGALFLVEGNYSFQLLLNYGIPRTNVRKFHMLFQRHESPTIESWQRPIRLLQVATYTEKKNQLHFLECLKKKHSGSFSIRMHGETRDPSYYRQLLQWHKKNPEHDVRILPLIPFDAYLSALAVCHVAVQWSQHASNGDSEGGCPVFIKDSLVSARPVISSRHCDITDWLAHGFNGFLTEPNDKIACTDLLDQLLSLSATCYRRLQRNALNSVYENMEPSHGRDALLEVYRDHGFC